MKRGYEFELSDGLVLQLVPNDGVEACSIAHGDVKIDVNPETGAFKLSPPASRLITSVPSVVRYEHKEFDVANVTTGEENSSSPDNIHALRNCMPCNGQWCCVSGGCGNCGCGWICG